MMIIRHGFFRQRRNFHSFPELTSVLASCKDLKSLLQIHGRLITSGFEISNTIKAHLVNLYASFGKCRLSRLVFDSVQNPPVILWNSMIRAYNRTCNYREALEAYDLMIRNGFEPDKYTFTFVLKASTDLLDLEKGILIHDDVCRMKLESDVFIGTGLVSLYCKTGHLIRAREVFDKMPERDVVAWNAMIAGLSHSTEPAEALEFFRYMQFGCGVEPNSVSLLNLFPAVCKSMDVKICKSLHGFVYRREFPISVYNGLIDTYSKCGCPEMAHQVFGQMRVRDDVSWGTMMSGYAYTGQFDEVLKLFDWMKGGGLRMNKVSAVSALMGAAEMNDLEKGVEVHDYTIQEKIDSDVMIATSLMTMYAKCGQLEKTKKLFRETKERDLVAWSAVISALSQSGYPEEALSKFREMQHENLSPNNVTLVSILPACAELMSVKLGKSIHSYAIKSSIDSDTSTGTALVSMYAKCNFFAYALSVFDKMPLKEVITWNALINGYAQVGESYNALKMFQDLRLSGLEPDPGTMVGVLPACALLGDIPRGTYIHCQVVKFGFDSDCHVTNALVDLYAKCGKISSAEFLFNSSCSKDEVSWNTLIAGYVHNERADEALSAFCQMKQHSFQPNEVTIVSILPALSYLVALKEGMSIHSYILKRGFQSNTLVGNSLVDMYGKCGHLDLAERIFNEMKHQDTVSWNTMLSSYSVHGNVDQALVMFSHMQENEVEIDSVSFLSVLSACRHGGRVEEGKRIFESMKTKHNLVPNVHHYACMVDLLGRAGLLDETMDLIKEMPMEPDAAVWGALLGASRMHCNVDLAELALKHLINVESENPAHYVELSNVYSQSGRWVDAGNARERMHVNRLRKNPGCSWVQVGQKCL